MLLSQHVCSQAGRRLLTSNIVQAFSIARAVSAIVFVGLAAISGLLTHVLMATSPAAHRGPGPVKPRPVPALRVRPDSVIMV